MTGDMPGSRQPIVLVITEPDDTTADRVCAAVSRLGSQVFRFDTADFPQRLSMSAVAAGRGWSGYLRTGDELVELGAITAVFVRRPSFFDLPSHLTEIERRHAGLEARYGLGGVLRSVDARWCNDMSSSADASYKPAQLDLFQRCGLTIPRTLVTNEPSAVRHFAAEVGPIVCKPLMTTVLRTAGRGQVVYTQLLTDDDLMNLNGVDYTAHLFQEFVRKAFEVRMTVVDQRTFAVRINAGSPRSYIDWRSDYTTLTYDVIDAPPEVCNAAIAYLSRAGLAFGAFDFAVTSDNVWYALECNPEGQWGWLADACRLPIADAIAEYLVTGSVRHE